MRFSLRENFILGMYVYDTVYQIYLQWGIQFLEEKVISIFDD